MTAVTNGHGPPENGSSASAVLRNRPFLLLWLSQVSTQIGATYPVAQLTVTPADQLTLPATDRSLLPAHGQPRL